MSNKLPVPVYVVILCIDYEGEYTVSGFFNYDEALELENTIGELNRYKPRRVMYSDSQNFLEELNVWEKDVDKLGLPAYYWDRTRIETLAVI